MTPSLPIRSVSITPPRIRSRRNRGFTLIEIILATALMAMVLATLSATVSIFTHLFETGAEQVSRAQWVTAVERQLRDDLLNAMEDAPDTRNAATSSPEGSSVGVRRFSFHGMSHSLRFDVLQIVPEDQIPITADALHLGPASALRSRAPELKTIVYRFSTEQISLSRATMEDADDIDALSSLTVAPGSGLTRWEIDFETPAEENAAAQRNEQTSPADAEDEPSEKKPGLDATFEEILAKSMASNTVTWLPEVRWASFRYFDGQSWSDTWDSLQRGSLPVAVEATLLLHDPTKSEPRPGKKLDSADENATGDAQEATAAAETLSLDEDGTPHADGRFTYRLLFQLPTARKRPELKPATLTASSRAASADERSSNEPTAGSPSAQPLDASINEPADLFMDRPSGLPRGARQQTSSSPSSFGNRATDASGTTSSDQWLRTTP